MHGAENFGFFCSCIFLITYVSSSFSIEGTCHVVCSLCKGGTVHH